MSDDRRTVDLSNFSASGFDRGRSRPVEVLWWLVKLAFIQSNFPWPMRFKSTLLRLFGARIGRRLYLRPGVDIHFPWKLVVGDNVWIGDRCTILNFEKVTLSDNSALAHEVYIAAAGHDITSPTFSYKHAPVHIDEGAWIATRAYIGPGVTVGRNGIVAAGAVVVRDVLPDSVVAGVPAQHVAVREIDWKRNS